MIATKIRVMPGQILVKGVKSEGITTKGGILVDTENMLQNLRLGRILQIGSYIQTPNGPPAPDFIVGDLVYFAGYSDKFLPMYLEDGEDPSPCALMTAGEIFAVIEDYHGKGDEEVAPN